MSIVIYGLRLRGEHEVRYIGQSRDPAIRLRSHIGEATAGSIFTPFDQWLLDNKASVEWFEIGTADTRQAARDTERGAIAFCLKLNHRLFNRHFVPAADRLVGSTAQPRFLSRSGIAA